LATVLLDPDLNPTFSSRSNLKQEDMGSIQWLELFQLFSHVTYIQILHEQLVPGVVQALVAKDMATEVLPEFTLLHLSKGSE